MGLIRKTLMVATGGAVSGSSKKQRVAMAQLKELRQQTRIAEQQAKNVVAQPLRDTPTPGALPKARPAATVRRPASAIVARSAAPTSFRCGRIPAITARNGNIVVRFDGSVIEVSQQGSMTPIALESLESATLSASLFRGSVLEFRVKGSEQPLSIPVRGDLAQLHRLLEKIYAHGVHA